MWDQGKTQKDGPTCTILNLFCDFKHAHEATLILFHDKNINYKMVGGWNG